MAGPGLTAYAIAQGYALDRYSEAATGDAGYSPFFPLEEFRGISHPSADGKWVAVGASSNRMSRRSFSGTTPLIPQLAAADEALSVSNRQYLTTWHSGGLFYTQDVSNYVYGTFDPDTLAFSSLGAVGDFSTFYGSAVFEDGTVWTCGNLGAQMRVWTYAPPTTKTLVATLAQNFSPRTIYEDSDGVHFYVITNNNAYKYARADGALVEFKAANFTGFSAAGGAIYLRGDKGGMSLVNITGTAGDSYVVEYDFAANTFNFLTNNAGVIDSPGAAGGIRPLSATEAVFGAGLSLWRLTVPDGTTLVGGGDPANECCNWTRADACDTTYRRSGSCGATSYRRSGGCATTYRRTDRPCA